MMPKKLVITLGAALVLLLLIPPVAYILEFWNTPISNDPTKWGVMGDYLGGILNPIISLASLCILGYLTYLVGKQGNEENKKLMLLEKRMDAYQDLTKHIKEINMMSFRVQNSAFLRSVIIKLPPPQQADHVLQMIKEMMVIAGTYKEFYYTLFTFKVKYGHLFKYDFNSNDFEELKKEIKSACDLFDLEVGSFGEQNEGKFKKEDLVLSGRIFDLLTKVVNQIREEVSN